MLKKPFNLYVSDLDATLLNADGKLSDYARTHLTTLLDEGLALTIASARSQVSMKLILDGLPLSLPVIEFNGACVTEWETGHHLHTIAIDSTETHPLYEKGCSLGIPPFITTVDGDDDWLYWPEPVNPEIRWLLEDRQRIQDPRLRRIKDMTHDFLNEQVTCMTFVGHLEDIETLREWTERNFKDDVVVHCYENTYHWGWYWFTVHPRAASKGEALKWLANHLGLSSDEICVFGDNDNDLSMFREAGHSVAVGNAPSNIKDEADTIIGTNLDNAVVDYLRSQH